MDSTRRTQAARSQQSRDQIVSAALTVFALKGYASASMDDVCMAAGCSKGGLYHHFPTKSAILVAVVERLGRVGGLLPRASVSEGGVPSQSLGRILIEIWAEAARDETLRTRLRVGYEEQLDHQLRHPERGNGSLATILRIGTLIQLLTRGEAVDAEELARRLGIERAA